MTNTPEEPRYGSLEEWERANESQTAAARSELLEHVLRREHERGWNAGYSAAIHDARVPGSRAHAELNPREYE